MDKEKMLLDFSIFVLMDIEELLSPCINFFEQSERNENQFDYKVYNYEEYIRRFIPTSKILENNILKSEIKSLNNFLSTVEINELKYYLNENFTEGYPDGDKDGTYGGNTPLEVTTLDLVKSFQRYVKYRNVNKSVFITYYIQQFDYLRAQIFKKLKIKVEKITNIEHTKELLDTKLSLKYIENETIKLEKKLFKSIKKNNFQFKGFADIKGVFVDFDKTILGYLEYLNQNFSNDFNYPPFLPKIGKALKYLTYQYYHFKINGKEFGEFAVHNLQEQLGKIKLENSKLIDYLNKKGFEENDINAVINLLHVNYFGDLEIRYFVMKQVEVYHVFHLFYIFDYFKEMEGLDFTTEKQFEKVLNLQSIVEVNKNSTNQFLKYYSNIESNKENNQYPFKSVERTLNKIVGILKIEKGNLKSIPTPKKN